MNTFFHPETDNYKYWTIQEEQKLQEMVQTGKYSFKEIGLALNRSGQSCQDHSIILGLNNKYKYKKYSVNDNFWSSPNLLNCYWGGFSSADAYIQEKGNSYTYRLEIQEKDRKHIENFIQTVNFNGVIASYCRTKTTKTGETFSSSTVCVHITSHKWAEDLKAIFNITRNKTKRLMPPNINDKYLLYSWLIGYIDGDGVVHYSEAVDNVVLAFTSASENLIKWIKTFLETEFIDCQLRKKEKHIKSGNNGAFYTYRISGIKAAAIIDFLSQFPVPHLERKWLQPKVLEYINQKKLQYPHLFKTLNQDEIKPLL